MELLRQIGVPFEVISVDVPEFPQSDESPRDYATRLASDKAKAGLRASPSKAVLGADTIVELAGRILEKPKDKADGIQMLAALSGQTHSVHTAVTLCFGSFEKSILVSSEVSFRDVSEQEAAIYWASGEPADKAGGYGIQGFGGVFVSHLSGSYSGVMGLPIAQTQQLLKQIDIVCWQQS
jgi:septum formation protein